MKNGNGVQKLYDQEKVDVMAWLRFPLILGVVFAHSNLYALIESWYNTEPEWPEWLIYIFNNLYWLVFPARIPTLFIISGYFFFRTQKNIDKPFFVDKFRRRVHSLLIPYIIWNTIAIAVLFLRFNVLSGTNYSITEYLSGYWSFIPRGNNTPANMPLWFLRDLMIFSLLTPVIYRLLKKNTTAIIYLAVMATICITDFHGNVTVFKLDNLLYFSVGAYIAIHKIDFTKIPDTVGIVTLLLYIPSQLLLNSINHEATYYVAADMMTNVIKITAAFYLVSLLFRRNILKPTPLLTRISFLLYVMHGIIIGPVIKTLYAVADSNNPFVLLGIYIIVPCIMVAFTIFIYKTMTRYMPQLAKVVIGNRK